MADLLVVVKDVTSAAGTYTIKTAAGSVGKILWIKVVGGGLTTTATYVVDAGGVDYELFNTTGTYEFGFPPYTNQAKSANKEMLVDDTAKVTIVVENTAVVSYALLNCAATFA
jgi:hypothetical protein